MRPTRPPLQNRIKNEGVAVASAVLSGLSLCAELCAETACTLRDEHDYEQEEEEEQLMAKELTKIEDYAFLSDTQTGALVSRDGCVDWLCFPRFDSPACFASLLGEKENGHWRFFPREKIKTTKRRYREETLILETEIETESGAVRLIDFMPPRGENPDMIRIIEGLKGKVSMHM